MKGLILKEYNPSRIQSWIIFGDYLPSDSKEEEYQIFRLWEKPFKLDKLCSKVDGNDGPCFSNEDVHLMLHYRQLKRLSPHEFGLIHLAIWINPEIKKVLQENHVHVLKRTHPGLYTIRGEHYS